MQKGELEYRVYYLEKLVNWMLCNGKFEQGLTKDEIKEFRDKGLEEVRSTTNPDFFIPDFGEVR